MGNLRLGSPAALLRNPGPAVCSQEEGSSSSETNCTEITSAVVELIVRTQLPRCKLSRTLERGCTAGRWGATMGSGGTLVRPDTPCNAPAVVVLSSQDPLCTNPALHPHHQHHHHHHHHYRQHQLVCCLLCHMIIVCTKIIIYLREIEM